MLDELQGQYYGHLHFQFAHPEALRRLDRLDGEIATAAWEMDVERQGLDGIAPLRPEPAPRAQGFDRDVPVLDRGIDLGLGL